jgi:hypothetical protein
LHERVLLGQDQFLEFGVELWELWVRLDVMQ